MAYKFEKLEVWQMSLEYADLLYAISEQLPAREDFNLRNQSERLFRRLQAFRNTLSDGQMRETNEDYTYDLSTPFD